MVMAFTLMSTAPFAGKAVVSEMKKRLLIKFNGKMIDIMEDENE